MVNKKVENLIKLSDEERYNYFVKKVCDFEIVWGLNNDSWVSAANDDGGIVLPFWPEQEFAALCATGKWEGGMPTEIALDDFLEKWLPGMERDGYLASVFSVPNSSQSINVKPSELLSDLREEMSQYE